MVQSFWYGVLILVQALQVDPSIRLDQVTVDVLVQGKPAWVLEMRGTWANSQWWDRGSGEILGGSTLVSGQERTWMVRSMVPDLWAEAESEDAASPVGAAPGGTPLAQPVVEPVVPLNFLLDMKAALSGLAFKENQEAIRLPPLPAEMATTTPSVTAKTAAAPAVEEEAFVYLQRRGRTLVLSDPASQTVLVLTVNTPR